jgi:hypothetical protein
VYLRCECNDEGGGGRPLRGEGDTEFNITSNLQNQKLKRLVGVGVMGWMVGRLHAQDEVLRVAGRVSWLGGGSRTAAKIARSTPA